VLITLQVCDTFAATMENKNIKLTKSFAVESAARHLGDPLRFRQVLCDQVLVDL
jgi:hypothetical protein